MTAALLAVPAAALVHSAMTQLPALEGASLAQPPTVTPGLLATVLAGTALLTVVLALAPMVEWGTGRRPARGRAAARFSVDALLLVIAGASWWQLDDRPATAGGGDAILTLAPVLFVGAVTILAVRCLPLLLGLAAGAASRSRSLVPLALHPVAVRLSTGVALVLLSTASAAATFGISLHTTWQRSQSDQADLRVGTGLSLTLAAPPTAEDTAAVTRAAIPARPGTDRPIVSPVTERPVALGRFVGDAGNPPQLVALDTRRAGALLRGRLENGVTWSDIGRSLAPGAPVRGVALPAGGHGVELVGHAPMGVGISVTPQVVVQDATGLRSTVDVATLPLDGRAHPLRWSAPPTPGQRIVALHLTLAGDGSGDPKANSLFDMSVDLRVPDPGRDTVTRWQARASAARVPCSASRCPYAGSGER